MGVKKLPQLLLKLVLSEELKRNESFKTKLSFSKDNKTAVLQCPGFARLAFLH